MHNEPSNFQEANLHQEWQQAMEEELKELHENNTSSIVNLPQGKKVVGSRWIYKNKFNSDESFKRYKAKLVACGFGQIFGVDYKEMFASITKMNNV